MRYKAEVIVRLKNGIRDPQGSAIETVLKRTQMMENEPSVKVGKFFSIEVEGVEEIEARQNLELIAQEVLSNPVLEQYEITRFEAM